MVCDIGEDVELPPKNDVTLLYDQVIEVGSRTLKVKPIAETLM